MAAPITHIVLTEKIFEKYFAGKDRTKFFVGTSFPDIRQLARTDRNLTHFFNIPLNDIIGCDSFQAGLKFHAYLDEFRLKFIDSIDLNSKLSESKFLVNALKYVEEEYLYDRKKDWATTIKYFDTICEEELAFGVPKETVELWHKALQYLFSQHPSESVMIYYSDMIKAPRELADQVIEEIRKVKKLPIVRDYVNELYEAF